MAKWDIRNSTSAAPEAPKPRKISATNASTPEQARMPSADAPRLAATSPNPIALQQESATAPEPAAARSDAKTKNRHTPVPETRPADYYGLDGSRRSGRAGHPGRARRRMEGRNRRDCAGSRTSPFDRALERPLGHRDQQGIDRGALGWSLTGSARPLTATWFVGIVRSEYLPGLMIMAAAATLVCARDPTYATPTPLAHMKVADNGNPSIPHGGIQQWRPASGAARRNSLRRSPRYIRHSVRMSLDQRRMDRTERPTDPGNRSWVAAEAAMTTITIHSNPAARRQPPSARPHRKIRQLSDRPVRSNASAPALAESRNIPSARPIAALSLWHFLRCTWSSAPVFGAGARPVCPSASLLCRPCDRQKRRSVETPPSIVHQPACFRNSRTEGK